MTGAANREPAATLRPARAGDAGALTAILSQHVDATDWMPRLHSEDDDTGFVRMLIAGGDVTVAVVGGRPVGFLARREATISALYVAAALRGQGVGRQLLQAAQGQVDRLELRSFRANAGARRFYARAGFLESARTEGAGNEENLPDVMLTWKRGL